MRLLVTSYEFPPVGGGGGQVAGVLARRLAALGDEVDVVTMGYRNLPRIERSPRLTVYRMRNWRRHIHGCTALEAASYLLSALPMVGRLARERDYDLVHSHFILPDGLLGIRAAQVAQRPFIITAHGTDVPCHNPWRVNLLHALLHPLWQIITSRAATVVCPSESLRHRVAHSNPRAKTTVIPNGADPDRFQTGLPRTNRILAVSRLVPSKGLEYLLQALQGLSANFEVVLVGDGPSRPQLQKLAGRLTMPVRFAGWLDNRSAELQHLYETSAIFTFPSEVENCPLALLDAMAAGLAIVTTRDTGCEALAGDAAILVPPRDPTALRRALERLMANPGLIQELGTRARARLQQHFGWDVVVDRHRDLYGNHLRKS